VKKDAVITLVAVVLVLAAAYVLASVRPDRPATPSQPFRPDAIEAKKKGDPNDKVIMHVNGEPVTESEFSSLMMQAPAEQRAFYGSDQGKRLLADELVKLKSLEQEGRRLGVDDEPEVRSQVESLEAQIVAGRTLERLVREQVDKNIQAEFAKEKANSKTLRHILIAYQGSAVPPRAGKPVSAEQAKQKAAALVARIRRGEEFGAVARLESDDQQTAPRGGTLGAARPDQLPPEIGAVVSSLKPGQISDPVQTQFGVHIFNVEEPKLEDMREMLTDRMQRQAVEETVTRLQKGAKVELDEKFFPPVPAQPAAPPKTKG
jgi:parvulin-like peptidyl-prolyl isomerase